MSIFALVESDSFEGNLHTNPLNFVHKNLTQISLQVDGVSFPSKLYLVDFETGRSLEGFDGLLDVLGRKHAPGGSLPFERDGYAKGYTFFAFDLSPSGCGRNALGLIKQGDVTISLIDSAMRACSVTAAVFRGVFAADQLPHPSQELPSAYIANCSDSTSGGTHWVAFYQDNPGYIETFDSYDPLAVEKIAENVRLHAFVQGQLRSSPVTGVVACMPAQRLLEDQTELLTLVTLFFQSQEPLFEHDEGQARDQFLQVGFGERRDWASAEAQHFSASIISVRSMMPVRKESLWRDALAGGLHVTVGAPEVLADVSHGRVVVGTPDKVDLLPQVVHGGHLGTGIGDLGVTAVGREVIEDEPN
ncbi:LOW QUALITY PROTEIN: hypothetical protein RvY_18737 [Ramazzottius varieornatus]|uniref:Uncharacterized protein n=1 Tax=Ramazzottius varieornatus TaxID=947166 RepID=A0A1D1W888_RAMVA|nr:LOW QUALITY PROTEIN: hypothetical protein RvY_18737 [Ramazzottius varieornatus]